MWATEEMIDTSRCFALTCRSSCVHGIDGGRNNGVCRRGAVSRLGAVSVAQPGSSAWELSLELSFEG